jgi:hypothetical protein
MTAEELLDLIRRYGDTYRADARAHPSGAERKRADRLAGEVFDEIETAVAALKADRDHLLTVLENTTNGLRMSLAGHTGAGTPLQNIDAARELLRQAEAALAAYKGAGT